MARQECNVCGKMVDTYELFSLKDNGFICNLCKKKIENSNEVNQQMFPTYHFKIKIEEAKALISNPTLTVKDIKNGRCVIKKGDENSKKNIVCIGNSPMKIEGVIFDDNDRTIKFSLLKDLLSDNGNTPCEFAYNGLKKFEYKEDEKSITTGGSGIGSALVGGMLFGPVGAIVGAATHQNNSKRRISDMSVFITFEVNKEVYVKKIKINGMLDDEIKLGSSDYMNYYNRAQRLMNALEKVLVFCNKECEIKQNNNENEVQTSELSKVDEIRQYKALLDDGIISQEEFEAKKKQLLSI